jgi:hypothetical protein
MPGPLDGIPESSELFIQPRRFPQCKRVFGIDSEQGFIGIEGFRKPLGGHETVGKAHERIASADAMVDGEAQGGNGLGEAVFGKKVQPFSIGHPRGVGKTVQVGACQSRTQQNHCKGKKLSVSDAHASNPFSLEESDSCCKGLRMPMSPSVYPVG